VPKNQNKPNAIFLDWVRLDYITFLTSFLSRHNTQAMTLIKNNSAPTKHIGLHIKLGNPKYECARYGICEFDSEIGYNVTNFEKVDKRAYALISLTKNQQLSLLIDRSSLTDKTAKEHFGSSFFTMEVAKELPISLSDKLGIKPSQIEAGMYSIAASKQHYKIVMALKSITDFKPLDCGCSKRQIDRRAVAL
jgi:hypothetical protein